MAAKTLKHKFVDAIADGADATLVRPSNWNDDHNIWYGSRTVTAATDTMADTDHLSLVQYNRATAIAVTLPQAGTSSQFIAGWTVFLRNRGVGQVTITPTTSTINEVSSVVLDQNEWAVIYSDGTNYAIEVSTPIDAITATWTASGTTYTAIKLDVTDTASAAGSLLVDLRVGGTSKFSVAKDGGIKVGSNAILDATSALEWGSTGVSSPDVFLARDAANQIGQRNSTNNQSFNIYNTYTDALNYERGRIGWATASNKLVLGSDASGTGTVRDVAVYISASERQRWSSSLITFFQQTDFQANTLSNLGPLIWGGSNDASLYRVAAKVLGFAAGGQANDGWMQWHGAQRVSSDQVFTSNVTLASVITWNVEAGRTYSFFACLLMSTGASAGGIKIAVGGTCTITNFLADGICMDGTTVIACTQRSAFGAGNEIVANTNAGTTPRAYIFGTITVNAAGTLLIRFAQNASNATSSTVKRGSYGICYDIA